MASRGRKDPLEQMVYRALQEWQDLPDRPQEVRDRPQEVYIKQGKSMTPWVDDGWSFICNISLHSISLSLSPQFSSRCMGSVVFYFRWGSSTCPSVLLYLGQIVNTQGSISNREGGYLCLADNPTSSNMQVDRPELMTSLVNKEVIPCTACAARRDTLVVFPNTAVCPAGWTLEYAGILAANPKFPSDNICVDNAEAAKLLASKSYQIAAVADASSYKDVYNVKLEPAVDCAVCSI